MIETVGFVSDINLFEDIYLQKGLSTEYTIID